MNGTRLAASVGVLAILVAIAAGAWWLLSQPAGDPVEASLAPALTTPPVQPAPAAPVPVVPPPAEAASQPSEQPPVASPLSEAEFLAIARQAAEGDGGPAAAGRMCVDYCAKLGENESAPEVRLAGARYLHLGQAFAEAEEQIRLLLDEHPELRDTTDALYTLGRAQLMQFREGEALDTFLDYSRTQPTGADADRALYLALMISLQKGDRPGAERIYADLESNYPESRYLYHAKQKLTGPSEEQPGIGP